MSRTILDARMEESVASPQKRKGSQWERDVATYLKDNGFPFAERAYGAGRPQDVGDIDGLPGIVLEAKNCAKIELAAWMDEAATERANAWARYGVVIAKRRRKPVSDAYAIMPLSQLAQLLVEAGYGAGTP